MTPTARALAKQIAETADPVERARLQALKQENETLMINALYFMEHHAPFLPDAPSDAEPIPAPHRTDDAA